LVSANRQRQVLIPGIGPLAASALVASIADAHSFDNGRQVSAWLDLVSRQSSNGANSPPWRANWAVDILRDQFKALGRSQRAVADLPGCERASSAAITWASASRRGHFAMLYLLNIHDQR
jgi:hypothetical protein